MEYRYKGQAETDQGLLFIVLWWLDSDTYTLRLQAGPCETTFRVPHTSHPCFRCSVYCILLGYETYVRHNIHLVLKLRILDPKYNC